MAWVNKYLENGIALTDGQRKCQVDQSISCLPTIALQAAFFSCALQAAKANKAIERRK